MAVAEFRDLTVAYGSFVALDSFTVSLPEGCIGLLGPNGAGKTTLIKTMLGFVDPRSGDGHVLGHDLVKEGPMIRQNVGYMPEQDCHIPGMSAVQFVAYAGELAGLPSNHAIRRAHEVLEYCGLGEARYRAVETYSTGMKQRIKLAQALVHGPKLLLLDEPTNGLDPRGREEMLELVRSVSHGKGLSVLLSSHLLKDVERICDHVVVLLAGRLRAQGQIRDLKSVTGAPVDVELREHSLEFVDRIHAMGMMVEELQKGEYRIYGDARLDETARRVFQAARDSGSQVRHLALAQRSLEEAFLEAVHV
ncbi:MAG TPA: ABC transporter ATP-binding protein [Fimbriimonadaceae bacterium]|nr:ABC transporter ATP-binding protein [Fimbriimonadaceae bacterium]